MQSLIYNNESIELKCNSKFQEQNRVTQRRMIELDVMKNMNLTNVIGHCNCHDAINAIPLFEHTLSVNSIIYLLLNVITLIIFQQAIKRNECKYKQ